MYESPSSRSIFSEYTTIVMVSSFCLWQSAGKGSGSEFYSLYFNTTSSSYFTKWVDYGLMDSTWSQAKFGSLHTTHGTGQTEFFGIRDRPAGLYWILLESFIFESCFSVDDMK
jgi:hypothetical protein